MALPFNLAFEATPFVIAATAGCVTIETRKGYVTVFQTQKSLWLVAFETLSTYLEASLNECTDGAAAWKYYCKQLHSLHCGTAHPASVFYELQWLIYSASLSES